MVFHIIKIQIKHTCLKKIFGYNPLCFLMNNLRNQELLTKFGERLKALRLSKSLTQEELCYKAEVELSQIYRIEKGKINPTLSTLAAIATALEINIAELLEEL